MKESDELNATMETLKKVIEDRHIPTMYLMVGLPRSGKSTWINENKDRLDAIVVSNDWIRENILHAPNKKATEPAIWMITDSCMRILLSQGKNVILDGINLTKSVRRFFVDAALECGAKIVVVQMATSLEECIKRNKTDHKLPDSVIESMCCTFQYPSLDECDEIIYIEEQKG